MTANNKDYSILVGGKAGQGSRKTGLVVAKLFSQLGYNIFIYDDYQSLIRGGQSFSQIRASSYEALSHKQSLDFLLALDNETVNEHKKDLTKEGIIIYDSTKTTLLDKNALGIDLNRVVEESKGLPIMKNIVLLASFAKVIGIKWDILEKVIRKEFQKDQELNLKIAKKAYEEVEDLVVIEDLHQEVKPLLTGNEALSLGAVKAGLDLYIAYPMTPATSILHYLAHNKDEFNVETVQLENELGVANAAVGAAYTGVRTMVGTSGGGFALMSETLSLAVQSEIPLVFVESQRMSPGSGVPTYNAQGDLSFVLNVGHGDILKFVAAPGDANEACFWAGKLLNLAWKYQTPVVLLIDKEISESTFTFNKETLDNIEPEKPSLWNKEGNYQRYKETKTGVSPLAFPGQKNVICKANSYEHDEFGITVEKEDAVENMQNKRLRKFKEMKAEVNNLNAVNVYGNKKSKKAIITWGSSKGAVKEASERLGIKMVQPLLLEPFPQEQMKKALQGIERIALVETNALGQLGKVLNSYQIKINKKVLKYNARPFLPCEIVEELRDF